MAESVVQAPNTDKVLQKDSSSSALEVSVSFGRFENDSLSWEKWSTFSPNKYMEEVEKCATPGSVAQKKAYFEAHYKKIAERKIELMAEHDKQIETKSLRPKDQEFGDLNNRAPEGDSQHSLSDGQFTHEIDENVTASIGGADAAEINRRNGEAVFVSEDQSLSIKAVKEEVGGVLDTLKMEKVEEVISVKEEKESTDNEDIPSEGFQENDEEEERSTDNKDIPSKGFQENDEEQERSTDDKDIPSKGFPENDEEQKRSTNNKDIPSRGFQENDEEQERKKDIPPKGCQEIDDKWKQPEKAKEGVRKNKEGSTKIDRSKDSSKVNQPNRKTTPKQNAQLIKERSATATKKKTTSPASRVLGFSTLKVSKVSSTTMSVSLSSTKEKISTLPRSKNSSGSVGKQMASKSLHMSLSLGPSSSDPASLTTDRKSLIMERMGDKDIVKRAFKTFQNRLRLPDVEQSAVPKQSPVLAARVSSSTTSQKGNGRSLEISGAMKKSAKVSPSSGKKSQERTQRTQRTPAFPKKMGDKSNISEAVRTSRYTKSKDEREREIKSLTQSLNYRATPVTGLHRGSAISKGSSVKDDKELETKRLAQSLNYKATPITGLHRGSTVTKGALVKGGGSVNDAHH